MNDRQDTIEDLFNRLGEQEKQNVINYAYLYDDKRGLRSEIRQLQSNWNSLREFINDWIEDLEKQRESIEGTDLFENHTLVILDDIKIRMNELEGKNKK